MHTQNCIYFNSPQKRLIKNLKNLNVSNSGHIGVLYYVDIPKGHVLRYDPKNGGTCTHVEVDSGKDPVSFVIPSVNEKEYLIGKGRSLCRLSWDYKQREKYELVALAEIDTKPELQDNRLVNLLDTNFKNKSAESVFSIPTGTPSESITRKMNFRTYIMRHLVANKCI